jgi:tRNA(Ile)-lysidine synthase
MVLLARIFSSFEEYKDEFLNKKILIAVSGGVDSLSLLLSFNEWIKLNSYNIYFEAITIDHKLRPSSTDEAEYVHNLCKKLKIKHAIKTWNGDKPKSNVELLAREKRYSLISEHYKKGDFECLLIAHHLDDQAETFFIRLFRGSGIDGLASMEAISALYGMNILRPFLELHKDDLKKYLATKSIKCVEDESNSDEKYLRNKIRVFLNSFENKNEIIQRIGFAIKEINKSKQFINGEFEKYKVRLLKFNPFGTCLVSYDKLKKINNDMCLRLLAHVSMKISGNVYKPRLEKLKKLQETIVNLIAKDKFRTTFYGCIFEKCNDGFIMVYREYNSIGGDIKLVCNEEIIWDGRFKVKLLVDEDNLSISHMKDGEFTGFLRKVKKENPEKYKELREIIGIQKNIFHTLPIVRRENEYLIDFKDISMEFI